MVPRETVCFVSPTRGKKKLTSFPRDHTLSVLLYNYLDFPLNNHKAKTNKQRQHVGNNPTFVSRICIIYTLSFDIKLCYI